MGLVVELQDEDMGLNGFTRMYILGCGLHLAKGVL